MRRKKDDKRVLRSGNGRQQNSRRKSRTNNYRQFFSRNKNDPYRPGPPRQPKKKRKSNSKLVLIMIIAIVAFVIGAGIGVSLSLDDGSDDGPHYKNVTKEMTSNLNETKDVIYDEEVDNIDYNENITSQFLKKNQTYTYTDDDYEDEGYDE